MIGSREGHMAAARATTAAAAAPRLGPPSLTLLPLSALRRRQPLARRRPPPLRPAAAAAAGSAGALPFPSGNNGNGNGNGSGKALPFLDTAWRTVAPGGGKGSADKQHHPHHQQQHATATATATAPAVVALPLPTPPQAAPPPAAPRVLPLPPPPRDASFGAVMPYLASLALSERQMWWRLAVASACMVVSKAAGLSGPLFLKRAVDALSVSGAAAADPASAAASAAAAAAASSSTSLPPAVAAVLCFGACSMLQHLAKELQHPVFTPVSQAVTRRVAHECFSHVLSLDIKFHLERRTGRISRILERGTRSVQVLYRAVLFTFAPTAVELVLVVALLAGAFSPLVAGLVGLTFLAYVAWTLALTHLSVEVRKRVNNLDNLATSKAVDALLNAETVALFDNAALEVEQYDGHLVGYQRAAVQTERLSALLNAGQSAVLAIGLTSVLLAAVMSGGGGGAGAVGSAAAAAAASASAAAETTGFGGGPAAAFQSFMAWAVATPAGAARFGVGVAGTQGVSGGDLVLLQGLLLQLWAPLQFLGWFFRELRASLVDLEEFFDVLRTPSSLPDGTRDLPPPPPLSSSPSSAAAAASVAIALKAPPPPPSLQPASLPPTANAAHADDARHAAAPDAAASKEFWGLSVELENVRFGYHPGRDVLKGVSLRVAPGESVALVGESGSGKSSILRLVTRLYDCREGSVRVGGVDVRDLRRASLRGATAVVPQETVLLNDTLIQNVRYGRPGASDADVMAAVRAARLEAAVARMPEGAETGVGERGLKLSGGEKQRVAIARAFLRAPRLLICDEASSALDSATEAAIMAELAELAQGRTCLYVAHRLSTVRGCDRIVVLSEGTVAEEGSHEQLLALEGGLYARMWARQSEAGDGAGAGVGDGRTRDEESEEEDGEGGDEGGRAAAAAAAIAPEDSEEVAVPFSLLHAGARD